MCEQYQIIIYQCITDVTSTGNETVMHIFKCISVEKSPYVLYVIITKKNRVHEVEECEHE